MTGSARAIWLSLGAALVALGLFLAAPAPHFNGLGPLLLGLVTIGSVLFEGRYRGAEDAVPGVGWAPTAEVFRDEENGGWLRVWQHRRSGARRYLPCEMQED